MSQSTKRLLIKTTLFARVHVYGVVLAPNKNLIYGYPRFELWLSYNDYDWIYIFIFDANATQYISTSILLPGVVKYMRVVSRCTATGPGHSPCMVFHILANA